MKIIDHFQDFQIRLERDVYHENYRIDIFRFGEREFQWAEPLTIRMQPTEHGVAIERKEPWARMPLSFLKVLHAGLGKELRREGALPEEPTEIERKMLQDALQDCRAVRDKLLDRSPQMLPQIPEHVQKFILRSDSPSRLTFGTAHDGPVVMDDFRGLLSFIGYELGSYLDNSGQLMLSIERNPDWKPNP